MSNFKYKLSKSFLEKKYIKENLSAIKIAKEIGCHPETIRKKMKKFEIPLRDAKKIPINESGNKYGSLFVVEMVLKNKVTFCKCECECGEIVYLKGVDLRFGNNTSCGCRIPNKGQNHVHWKGHGELSGYMWALMNQNSNVDKRKMDITIEDAWRLYLKQNRKCALSGVEIKFAETANQHRRGETTASLDRIDSNLNYRSGNIQWVHKDINKIKTDLNQDYFLNLCISIANYQTKKELK